MRGLSSFFQNKKLNEELKIVWQFDIFKIRNISEAVGDG